MDTQMEKNAVPKPLKRPIYLDHNATTPVDPAVFLEMRPYLEEEFGNASSKSHSFGWKADMAVEKARKQVAQLLHCDPQEIIWTSGATESNNMVLLSFALNRKEQVPHFITSPVEHKAVLDVCKMAQNLRAELTILEVNSYGQVEPETLKKALKPNTRLVSIMAANNEIGTLNPIQELCKITKEHGAFFHTDAAQAVGKVPVDLQAWNVDFLSISGHKIYGPKGIGALFVRREHLMKLKPLMFGGLQEKGLRPGTLNVPGIVGLGKACELSGLYMKSEHERLLQFQKELIEKISQACPEAQLNGHPTQRLCNNVSFSFEGISPDCFALDLSELALSSGSACNSGAPEVSHVLKAIGTPDSLARSTLRLGLGRFNSPEEIATAAEKIIQMVSKNRKKSKT